MAKGYTKIPLESTSGSVGNIDRTIGREGGFAVNFSDATADGSVKIGTKRVMPPGGSEARHDRAASYCACDVRYKMLDFLHRERLCRWFRAAFGVNAWKISPYATWIKVCLLRLPVADYFATSSWWGRWTCFNDTSADTPPLLVTVHGMKRPMRSTLDCVVVLLDVHSAFIEILLPVSYTADSVSFWMPVLPAHTRRYLDVYWLTNVPKGWFPV